MSNAIDHQHSRLTALVEPDDGRFTARCPELDLAVAADTPEQAFRELVEASIDYAEEYVRDAAIYDRSPNRKHHRPMIDVIREAGSAAAVGRIFARKGPAQRGTDHLGSS